jgi:hypothetical protein
MIQKTTGLGPLPGSNVSQSEFTKWFIDILYFKLLVK